MPRKKTWRMSKARRDAMERCTTDLGVFELSDGGRSHPLPSFVLDETDVRPSVSMEGVFGISDGGLAHPQKPSVSMEGVFGISDGGLAHPQKPSVSGICSETVLDTVLDTVHETANDKLCDTVASAGTVASADTVMEVAVEERESNTMIFGTFHQGNEMFNPSSRSFQCTANALCSMIYTELQQLHSSQSLDNILIEGDALHRRIVTILKAKNKFRSLLLNLEEIPSSVNVFDRTVSIVKGNIVSGVFIQSCTNTHMPSLHNSLIEAFTTSSYLLFIIGSVCSAIFRKDGRYCLFDSHSHGSDGLSNDNGRSLLASFLSIDDLVAFMYTLYQSMNINLTEQFDMMPIAFVVEGNLPESKKNDNEFTEITPERQSFPLIDRYFKDQSIRQKRKQEVDFTEYETVHECKRLKRREYMRNYKRKQRLESNQKLKECLMTKESMRKIRQDTERQVRERLLTRDSMQKIRQDPKRLLNENITSKICKQKARQDPKRQAKERIMTNISMKKVRADPERQVNERIFTNMSMQKARKDPERQVKERVLSNVSKQKARQVPGRQLKERVMSNISKQKTRQVPERQVKERELSNVSKQKARQVPERQLKERVMSNISKRKARQCPERQVQERAMSNASKKKSRLDLERKVKEKFFTKSSMQKVRKNEERNKKERTLTLKSMHKCRSSKLYKDLERLKKQNKRASRNYLIEENIRNKAKRQCLRSDLDYMIKEKNCKSSKRYGCNIKDCIEKFKKNVSKGPVYVCSCCNQTWFKHSVVLFDKLDSKCSSHEVKKFSTGYISVDGCEWLCKTCYEKIKLNKVPPMSVFNRNEFPVKPKELNLHQLEERLVSLRIPFMQIRELPRGGQLSIKGNVVNVPVDVQPVIHSLPRTLDSHHTIPVKLKKKLSYNKCDFTENIRPLHVLSALHWLVNHSVLYKESGIKVDDGWIQSITSDCSDAAKEFFGISVESDSNKVLDNDDDVNYDSDHFSEVDETEKVMGNSDTMLDIADPTRDNVYTFAPGEGQTPLSLYQDSDAEYLSFPTIFCGQRRTPNEEKQVPIHFSETCKLELRHIDRRVASNIPNIFFKLKKVQLKQISDKVHLALRRCKKEGKTFTASQMLDSNYLQSVVRLDEGFYIFRSLRNSPPYFEARKKDVFAMIRQLGLPTWFTSLSSADTRWHDLLNMLSEINNGKSLSEKDIDELTWIDKTKLVQKDPVTCVRYFDNRVQEFINTVLQSPHNPLGKVMDYFYRVEFQQRGSPHIHMLIWIENSPRYQESSIEDIALFIDKYVSCEKKSDQQLVELQVHKHSKSCRKKQKSICRFGFPIPPMKNTTILEPLNDSKDKQNYKKLFEEIQKKLDEMKDTNITQEEFLTQIKVNEDDYVKAIQSSLNGPKVFLKRRLSEVRINAYMKPILNAWGANHDLQFVLDPYACAVYIVSYISKAQRGMSILMNEACKEARRGNMDLRQQVRHIGNKFLNSVEVSAQEACYLLLQQSLTKASKDVVFINTSLPEDRTFLLKSKEAQKKMSSNSTDIEADNIIKRYSKRPRALENWCLADYVSQLDIKYNNNKSTSENSGPGFSESSMEEAFEGEDNEDMDIYCNDDEVLNTVTNTSDSSEDKKYSIPGGRIVLKNGIVITERKHRKVIRYVRFSKKIDIEQFCRERLLLFSPWRDESIDLKLGHDSYLSRYRSIKNSIEHKASQYEKNADELEDAMERAQNEEDFDNVAPGTEQSEQDDANIGAKASESFIFFDPDRPENQRQGDIAGEFGLNVASVDVSFRRKTMSDMEYRRLINSLNTKQREFFIHVFQTIKCNDQKLKVFLTGGAGVGKSVLVSALFEALQRFLTSDPGDNPENCRVLLCAPTGKAAFHINGVTLHSAFRIPASQGYDCTPLSSDTLNTLRTKYKDLSVVMIDEVSMVGNNMLKLINERLKQIKGSDVQFGGLHMIFIGDLFQLKPVMDGWIFENLKSSFGPLATNLWQDIVVMHEFDEIMRQKNDKQFAEILNRLREGNHTEDDIEILKQRLTNVTSTEYPQNTTHLFNTNEKVNNFNVRSFLNNGNEKVNIPSLDHVLGDDNVTVKQQLVSRLPNDSTHTAGLSHMVGICVGMIYDLCLNLDVDDGLVNGSSCVVEKIEYRQNNTARPSIIWVSFKDDKIGTLWRSKYKHLYHSAINLLWTPIFDCKRNFLYLRKTFVRIQIPLRQSTAKTVHKSQGDTLSQVVIDMDGKRVFPHAHYVAISRSRTLEGLYIVNLNESKISVSSKVKEEMVRLRQSRKLELCYTPVYMISETHFSCLFNNVQSFRSHKDELFSDPNVETADCLCLLETWLTADDSIDLVQRTGYQIVRADGKQIGNVRPHRGIIVYVRDTIHISHSFSVVRKNIEMIVVELVVQDKEIVIATVYNSPKSCVADLKIFLTQNLKTLKGKCLLIQGDFNINSLDRSTVIENFIQDFFKCKQLVKKPTHYSGSLIDHIYSNIPSTFTDVIECVWSDHSMVYAAIPK